MYKKETLKNGVRLITAPLTETKTANILVLFGVGSRYESEKLSGASHFVEHMMFKGTKKRPNTLALSKVLDGVGAKYNAFTGKDYTGYYVKTDSKHFKLAIDVISDMLLNSKFEASEVEREKGVILEEINMYEDNPLMYVEELMEEIAYKSSPLGMMIAGTRESVKGLTKNDLFEYKKKTYKGKNVVIAVSGNFSDENIKDIREKFSLIQPGSKNNFEKFKSSQKKPRLAVKFKETEQVQVCFGLPGYAYGDRRIIPQQLLSVILGGNMSSRLFLSVREKNGLAYYVGSSVNYFRDTGMMHVQAGLDKSRISDAIKLIIEELKKISSKGIKPDELKRAKDYIIGKTAIDLEDTSSLSQWYAIQELMVEKIYSPEERMKLFGKVTSQEVERVAKETVNLKKINLAVIGPFKDDKEFRKLL